MICLLSVHPSFKIFYQLQSLLLQFDECLGVGLKLTYHLLGCSNRMISVEDFHSFVVKDAYLVRQGNNLRESFYARFSRRVFFDDLKGFAQEPCSDKVALRLCFRLLV